MADTLWGIDTLGRFSTVLFIIVFFFFFRIFTGDTFNDIHLPGQGRQLVGLPLCFPAHNVPS